MQVGHFNKAYIIYDIWERNIWKSNPYFNEYESEDSLETDTKCNEVINDLEIRLFGYN